jgi:hypothetical protein
MFEAAAESHGHKKALDVLGLERAGLLYGGAAGPLSQLDPEIFLRK